MLRIGIVIYGNPDQTSGGYLYDRMLRKRLQASGHYAEFLSIRAGSYLTRPVSGAVRSIPAQVRETGPFDVLIIDELCHPSFGWRIRRLRRVVGEARIVVLVHHLKRNEQNMPGMRAVATWFEKGLLSGTDGLIFNSKSTEYQVGLLRGDPIPSVIAVPSGRRFVSAEETTGERIPLADASDLLRILFVGNLIPRKGFHTLLEAVSKVGSRRLRVTAVGSLETDHGYVGRIKRQVARLGLLDNVTFTGKIDDASLERVYSENDLFCVPSQFEGFGIVYLEAMGFGLPSIGSSSGGAVDIIQDGTNGFLVEPGDADTIAGHLDDLNRHPGRLRQMSVAARETYLDSPTWDESMARIEKFLVDMTNNGGV